MVVVNFSHPLTPLQKQQLEEIAGAEVSRTIDLAPHFRHEESFQSQAEELVEASGLTSTEWQSLPIVVNLPSLSIIAALVLAELHGRMGYFPAVMRLRPVGGAVPARYEVAEVVSLQAIRDAARARR